MKRLTGKQTLWIAAFLILAIGLASTAGALRNLRGSRSRFAQTLRELQALQDIENGLSLYLGARAAFDALPQPKPSDPREILVRVLPGVRVDEAKEERLEAAPGWTLRRKEVVFGTASFPKVMEFVEAAESQRPPWRMIRCSLRATSPDGGIGQAAIVLEALEKTL